MSHGQPGAADPLIGQAIGSYVVQRRLGAGGMGAVYELLHPGIGKRLALKLLHAEYAARPQIVQRFFDEARAVNLIGHPNIVDIIDFAELPDGRSYITMEYLEGDSLGDFIRQRGAMPPADVERILIPLCSALQAAHEAGIVHRDLKPENIHLVPRPDNPHFVKVLDFGIAKLTGDLQVEGGVGTQSGVVMGTPTYMSPEQAMGRTRLVDHRTDVYALGVIIYQMLAGRVPFAAESFGDLMLKHLQEAPPPLASVRPDLGPGWEAVVATALAKEREHRFASMTDFAAAVRAAAGGMGAHDATMRMQPNAAAAGPPAMPGGGTARYPSGLGSQPHAATAPPSQPHAATAPPSQPHVTAPPSQPMPAPSPTPNSRAWIVPLIVLGILGAAAALVLTIVGGGDRQAVATAPVDAAAPAFADAGILAMAPADAALPDATVIAAGPPDAAITATPPVKRRPKPDPVKVERRPGTLRIVVAPWAEVTIDGKSYGSTPVTAKLPAGRHTVVVQNPELGKKVTRRVRVQPDRTDTVKLDWTR